MPKFLIVTGADPGFWAYIQANLGDFLKNLTQKRVGVRALPSGYAPVLCAYVVYLLLLVHMWYICYYYYIAGH